MSEWKTSISKASSEGTLIRGYNLKELVGKLSFSEMIYLVLKGKIPKKEQAKMLDAIFVACVEHRLGVPSILAARYSASAGNQLNASIAAGILGIGDWHGGAIEQAAKVFQENLIEQENEAIAESIVQKFKSEGKRLPGYGHKIYTDEDPRAKQLLEIAKDLEIFGKHCKLALNIKSAIEKIMNKKLCLNVDGAIAAIISDMGFDWRLGKAFFIIPRTVGITAHVYEEITKEKPFRQVEDDKIIYEGTEKRELNL